MNEIYITNRSVIEGKIIEKELGIVYGSAIPTRSGIRDMLAGFRNLLGKELKEYSELMDKAREMAIDRLKQNANKKGANAVLNLRMLTNSISEGAAEIITYGTAVKLA